MMSSALIEVHVNGQALRLDPAGALLWPDAGVMALADLHLEKASSLARRGQLLPPYDTRATLARLAALVAKHRPRRLLLLGDSFHDREGHLRLAERDLDTIAALAATTQLLWIEGNHDRGHHPPGLGEVVEEWIEGALVFRHEARRDSLGGEISGHYHPRATVPHRAGRVSGRCFVTDGQRAILPAFGAYTGGLDVLDPVYAPLFPDGFDVVILGERRAVRFPASALI